MRRRLRHDLGQASLDYVTVLAIAGIALTAGAGVAMAKGGAIAGSVRSQMVRALCVVTGGDCDRDLAPCVVGTKERALKGGVSVLLFRISRDRVALIEERSDGRFDVTIADGWNPGAELGLGGKVRIPKTGVAIDGEVRATVLAHLRGGRTWGVGSLAEAERLVKEVGGVTSGLIPAAIRGGAAPEPDQEHDEKGWTVELGGAGKAGSTVDGELSLGASDFSGSRRDRRTGHVVHYLTRSQDLGAKLAAGKRVSGGLEHERLHVWAIEQDERGRPVDLMILESGEYRGTMSLPDEAAQVAGYLGVPGKIAERYEVERHLDLTVPENLEAALGFVLGVVGPFNGAAPFKDRVPVSGRLQALLDRSATVHARTYSTTHSSDGGGLTAALGLKLGAEYETSTHESRLVGAATRGPDGTWQDRTDCLGR